MINIDFLTLKAFFLENIDFIIGARLQKIQQPTRKDFILSLRNNSESRKLYININPNTYHMCFMGVNSSICPTCGGSGTECRRGEKADTEKRRNLKIPKQPPMFCMLLRKYLEGCKIADALVVENERIIEFHFETMDELSQRRSLCLCVELMGKHSNVILYDRETSIIIGCAHNVGSEKSRYRELQGGLKYIYPPAKNLCPPCGGSGTECHRGVYLSNELKSQFSNLDQKQIETYLTTEEFRPAISADGNKYTLFAELLENSVPVSSVNEMLDQYYSKIQEGVNVRNEKSKLSSIVLAKLKKVNSSKNKIELLLKKRDNTEKYKLYGDLLTANLYLAQKDTPLSPSGTSPSKGADYICNSIEVLNYNNGENIIIELDETKTLSENAQRYYKLYTKSKNTKEKTTEILNGLNIEKEYLENVLYSIDKASSLEDLEEIAFEIGEDKSDNKKKTSNPLTKIEINGFDVYIGKNNKQNDYIVSKLSKDEDYWFHTRLCAGSHVLLKVNEKEPDEETIFECCKLARENSSAKQPSKVGVIYTKRKYIKKPPASPLGYVIYKNEKEVLV